ncbi:hypothetical protein Tco_0975363 [Tanacetum coccineum]|uniref:Uncharacterized protein n=1 Tax=Tanacetum coccineum TaxID=301880 RepID=A0ABQ5EEB3_9ASTR
MDLKESRILAGAWLLETERHSACMHDSREHINNLLVVQRTDMAGGAVLEAAGKVNEPEATGPYGNGNSKQINEIKTPLRARLVERISEIRNEVENRIQRNGIE